MSNIPSPQTCEKTSNKRKPRQIYCDSNKRQIYPHDTSISTEAEVSEIKFRCGPELNFYKNTAARLQSFNHNDQFYNPRFRPHIRTNRKKSESTNYTDSESSTSRSRSHSRYSPDSLNTPKRKKHKSGSSSISSSIEENSRSNSRTETGTDKLITFNYQHSRTRSSSASSSSSSVSSSCSSSRSKSWRKSRYKNSEDPATYSPRSRLQQLEKQTRPKSASRDKTKIKSPNHESKHRHADMFRNSQKTGEKFPLDNSSPSNTHEQSNHLENAIDQEQKKTPKTTNTTTNTIYRPRDNQSNISRNTTKCKKKRTRDDDSDSSMQNFFKKRISGTQKTDSEISEIEEELSYREYVRRKEKKESAKFKIHRGRVSTKDFRKLFRNTIRAFEYKQIPKKPFPENKLKEAVYNICSNGCSNTGAIIMYFTRSKQVAEIIKTMQRELMIRPNITVSEPFKMNHAPPNYYDKDAINQFIELQKQGPQELWDKLENNTHDLFTRHSDVKTLMVYAATPIDFVMASKICNKYAKDKPKEIVLRVCSIIDGDNSISIYNSVSRDFKSKYLTLSKC